MDLEWYFYAITGAIFLLTGLVLKKWRIALLLAYIFFIVAVTILSRKPFSGKHFEPKPFWSWSDPQLREQIIMNIVGFIPLGIIGASLLKWKIIPIAATISLAIETIQLLTKTGLFETDDVIHNTLGAAIGYGIFTLAKALINRRKKDPNTQAKAEKDNN